MQAKHDQSNTKLCILLTLAMVRSQVKATHSKANCAFENCWVQVQHSLFSVRQSRNKLKTSVKNPFAACTWYHIFKPQRASIDTQLNLSVRNKTNLWLYEQLYHTFLNSLQHFETIGRFCNLFEKFLHIFCNFCKLAKTKPFAILLATFGYSWLLLTTRPLFHTILQFFANKLKTLLFEIFWAIFGSLGYPWLFLLLLATLDNFCNF